MVWFHWTPGAKGGLAWRALRAAPTLRGRSLQHVGLDARSARTEGGQETLFSSVAATFLFLNVRSKRERNFAVGTFHSEFSFFYFSLFFLPLLSFLIFSTSGACCPERPTNQECVEGSGIFPPLFFAIALRRLLLIFYIFFFDRFPLSLLFFSPFFSVVPRARSSLPSLAISLK